MTKRYAISPILGTGTPEDPYRAAVSDVPNVNSVSIIKSDANGDPLYDFALSVVATSSLSAVLLVTNSYVFPDYVLDGRMDGMESAVRTAMDQSVAAYDLDGSGLNVDMTFYGDDNSYREVIIGIGQQFEPAFNINAFDASEPTA